MRIIYSFCVILGLLNTRSDAAFVQPNRITIITLQIVQIKIRIYETTKMAIEQP